MTGRPAPNEADPSFYRYIDLVSGDLLPALHSQLSEGSKLFDEVESKQSLTRYEPGKWSIREVLSHMSDTERVFAYRALWFARGYESELPNFDQDIAVANAEADTIEWSEHIEDFRRVRLASISLFEHLPAQAWARTGTASGKQISVKALGYLVVGHAEHHLKILRERYLTS